MSKEPLDLAALREIASAATEGPWRVYKDTLGALRSEAVETAWTHGDADEDTEPVTDWCLPEDAAHIAAFDPQTALTLLDRLEAADARWARVEAELADAEAREDNIVPKWFRLAVDPK